MNLTIGGFMTVAHSALAASMLKRFRERSIECKIETFHSAEEFNLRFFFSRDTAENKRFEEALGEIEEDIIKDLEKLGFECSATIKSFAGSGPEPGHSFLVTLPGAQLARAQDLKETFGRGR